MSTVYTIKEQAVPDTPLLLFECKFGDGSTERWSTHKATVEGNLYPARVLAHNSFELRGGSEDGVDGVSRISVTLANADSRYSQLERSKGFKGSKLTVRFVFYDLKTDQATTPSMVVFRGSGNAPEESSESQMRLSFNSRLNLARVLLPNVRIQRRCPWVFPKTAAQRNEAVSGGNEGKYSAYFRCGYSPDQTGGVGSLNGAVPFTSCDYTRAQCEQRGMFDKDSSNRPTKRFGGVEFVPASTLVRGVGESGKRVSEALENSARYNDFVPMVYGTGFYQPPIVFAKNDGNLTRMEVLLGLGEIQGVLKVLVNGIEIPLGQSGANMTATGWYNLVTPGNRTGGLNTDFADSAGIPLGDPYGSMAYLSLVAPNRVSDGRSLPKVEVLVQGLKVSTFDLGGGYVGEQFSNNPAWVLLDILRRCGWTIDELDAASFAKAAAYCDQTVTAKDLNGNSVSIPRYQCNAVLRRRQSAAEIVRGIRNAAALYLTYADGGKLQLRIESKIATQHPVKPAGSNSSTALLGGWPAYEFGDGSNGFSGILRYDSGAPAIRFFSRGTADTPNRVSLEFQDAFNEYQHDSVSVLDADDALLVGQEVAASLNVAGMPNPDQALRIAQLQLSKSLAGNSYVEFETSMKGLGIRPGDLITLTYLKEGFDRQLFRVARIAPKTNFRTATISAQIHEEAWYDGGGASSGAKRRRRGAETGIPLPITGKVLDAQGRIQFEIGEAAAQSTDGGAEVELTVEFTAPGRSGESKAAIPILSFAPAMFTTGGTIAGGQNLYYAISGVDSNGLEGEPSFSVRASVPAGTNTNRVRLDGLSFNVTTTGFHVYRGSNPQQMQRIESNVAVAPQFVDTGLAAQFALPPDPSYDHANFYWRLELLPEVAATAFAATTVGNSTLTLIANEFRGAVVRITTGKGMGQERNVIANDGTSVAIDSPWTIVPDTTSKFAIAEAGWKFAALSRSDRAVFAVPNRGNATVQVLGRAANVRDEECPAEISPLTRWVIGGAAGAALDLGVPLEPVFGLTTAGDGTVELLSVGFANLDNTRSITAGTLTLHFWNELASPSAFALALAITAEATQIDLNVAGSAAVGDLIQIGAEVIRVTQVQNGGLRYQVVRGSHQTTAAAHAAAKAVYHLERRTAVVPFANDFFGSPASGSFAYPVYLSNARVAAADLFVTNSQGESPVAAKSFTANVDQGLRTLTGGQMTVQADGYLAIQSSVAPPLVTSEARAIRDVFATVGQAPSGGPIQLRVLSNGAAYCDLTIPAGATVSSGVSRFGVAALPEKAAITVDVLSVPSSGSPGNDLSVTLRY